jgi:hypothetical protein
MEMCFAHFCLGAPNERNGHSCMLRITPSSIAFANESMILLHDPIDLINISHVASDSAVLQQSIQERHVIIC